MRFENGACVRSVGRARFFFFYKWSQVNLIHERHPYSKIEKKVLNHCTLMHSLPQTFRVNIIIMALRATVYGFQVKCFTITATNIGTQQLAWAKKPLL